MHSLSFQNRDGKILEVPTYILLLSTKKRSGEKYHQHFVCCDSSKKIFHFPSVASRRVFKTNKIEMAEVLAGGWRWREMLMEHYFTFLIIPMHHIHSLLFYVFDFSCVLWPETSALFRCSQTWWKLLFTPSSLIKAKELFHISFFSQHKAWNSEWRC